MPLWPKIPLLSLVVFWAASPVFGEADGTIPSLGEVVRVDSADLAATQSEVGLGAVEENLMKKWAKEAKQEGISLKKYLKNEVLNEPFPAAYGPDIWTGNGNRYYIKDGHHHSTAVDRILHSPYRSLPSEIKDLISASEQLEMRVDPKLRMRIRVEQKYGSVEAVAIGFAKEGIGQLPPSVRNNPLFLAEVDKAKAGAKNVNVDVLLDGFRQLAKDLKSLKDSPLRSAMGSAFNRLGIPSEMLVYYSQFTIGERLVADLNAQGIQITASNWNSDLVQNALAAALMDPNKEHLGQLQALARYGSRSRFKEEMRNVLEEYRESNPAPVKPGTGCPAKFNAL